MRETEEELALLRRYVDKLEASHGLRSETAAGVRWDIDLALEGDVLALAKCQGQLRTARRHKQGSAILASLETEGGGHGGGDGIPGGGPGAGRRDAVDVPAMGGDAMSDSKWTPEMEDQASRAVERCLALRRDWDTAASLMTAALGEIRRLRDDLRDGDQAQLELEHKAARARIEGARAMQEKASDRLARQAAELRTKADHHAAFALDEAVLCIRALKPEDVIVDDLE